MSFLATPAVAEHPPPAKKAGEADADENQEPPTIFVFGKGMTYEISVGPAVQTYVDFPGQIQKLTRAVQHPDIDVRQVGPNRLRVIPAPHALKDAEQTVHVNFTVRDANFRFKVHDKEQAESQVNVHLGDHAALRAMAAKLIVDVINAAQKRVQEATQQVTEAEAETGREKVRLLSKSLLDQIDGVPACDVLLIPNYDTQRSLEAGPVRLSLLASCWNKGKTHLLVPVEIENGGPNPFRATSEIEVTDKHGNKHKAYISFVRKPDNENASIATNVGANESVRGVIAIELDEAESIDHLRIRLNGPKETRWLQASVTSWNLQRAKAPPAYTGDDWAEEVRRREARAARATQLIVGPSGAIGACWLSNGVDQNNKESATCATLGLRLTKGITEMIAFEIDAVGGGTGDAKFGTATRNAKLGRVTASGVLRFGQWTIPYFRFGIGAQGVDHSGGSSLALDLIWTVGVGITRRFGQHWLASAGLSVNEDLDGESLNGLTPTLQAGLSIGYGWNPSPSEDGKPKSDN